MNSSVEIKLSGLGWVLPAGVGSGTELVAATEAMPVSAQSALVGFKPREYISSVKGYLDPGTAYTLAASALAVGKHRDRLSEDGEHVGVSTITEYGAAQTASRFFELFLEKGARLASPLLFPHGYPNTAGNLSSIEFGFAGPHLVLYGDSQVGTAIDFGLTQLRKGSAKNMLVGAYEATVAEALPGAEGVLNGAVVAWLSIEDVAPCLCPLPEVFTGVNEVSPAAPGSVQALVDVLGDLL